MRRSLYLVPVLLAAACGGESVHGPSALPGSAWKLDSLRSAAGLVSPVDPSRYTLEFQEAFRVRAQADCNVCTGSYRTATSIQITIGPLACTRAFCGSGSRGDEYVTLLNTTKLYALEGDTLVLSSDEGTLLYRP
ncbi:MAG TPA: META domain-containing protein [Vicinamibacteria bacterium]|nr:META domain-containing protein [Vicinamibacteria bacterium]